MDSFRILNVYLGEEWWQPFDLALSAILSDIKMIYLNLVRTLISGSVKNPA